MDERTTGIVLRTRPLTETSLIVHWLTRDLGRIATVAKGARRPKSAFRGKLDLFYRADLSLARSRRSDLHTLREVMLLETHPALRHDLTRLHQASYAVALIEQTTETGTPMSEMFELVGGFLQHLCVTPPETQAILAFELKLLSALGLQPDYAGAGGLTAGTRLHLEKLGALDWTLQSRLKLTGPQRAEATRFLHRFMAHHLGRIPASRVSALADEDSVPPGSRPSDGASAAKRSPPAAGES